LRVASLRHARQIDTLAIHVEFQAVIDAAQPIFLVATVEQRCGAMWAALVEQPDASLRVAEQHQVFAEQPHAHRRTVGLRDML